jgi:hypothetical protein
MPQVKFSKTYGFGGEILKKKLKIKNHMDL